ncbi:4Fe-4S binding protein [bacterium]|nr:4Fe-4S binding protein [bacterium]
MNTDLVVQIATAITALLVAVIFLAGVHMVAVEGCGISGGLKLVFSKFLRNYPENSTLEYPGEIRKMSHRWKGRFVQLLDESGRLRCDACQLCAQACPDNLIEVLAEGKGRERRPRVYTLNYAACHNCGLCVDICPSDAIRFSRDFETASYDRADAFSHDETQPLIYNLEDLVTFESAVYPELYDSDDPDALASSLGYFKNKNIFNKEDYVTIRPMDVEALAGLNAEEEIEGETP